MLKWAGKIHTMLSRETKFTCQLCYVNKGIFGFLFLDCVSRSSWVFYVVRLKEVKLSYLCSSPLSGTGQWSWANIWHGWCMVFSLNYTIWRSKVFDVLRDKWFTSEYKGFAQHDGLVMSLSERHAVPVWNLKCRLQQSYFEQLIQLISAHIMQVWDSLVIFYAFFAVFVFQKDYSVGKSSCRRRKQQGVITQIQGNPPWGVVN